MKNEANGEKSCTPMNKECTSCKVEALVSVDERGQMVLPKEIREKANIRAGDKLALVSCEKKDKTYCIFLIKADELTGMVKDVLSPLMKEMTG